MRFYQDFDRCTSLDKDNFNFYKEIDGRPMISPCWSFCLSYELELRKEAIKLCNEQAFGIQAALWAALRDKEHRMKHWLQLVAIPNSAASSDKQEMQNMKKSIADLEKARSRSPRRGSQSKQSAQLALPGPSAPAQGAKGGKGSNNNKGKGKGKSSSSSQPASSSNQTKNFQYLMKLPIEFRSQFHERFHKREICFSFQRCLCKSLPNSCKFAHVCVGCGGPKPYDECMCLSNRAP